MFGCAGRVLGERTMKPPRIERRSEAAPSNNAALVDGAPVDMTAIETRISALRAELDELRAGRLSPQTIEVLLTDLADIWNWSGQLRSLHGQVREEMHTLATAQRDLAEQLRTLIALLERRTDRRMRWQALVRERPAPSPPLADLRLAREPEAPRKPSGEGVVGAGEGEEVAPGGGEG